MKKFAFPLERVLEWRRLQERLEESRLEALHGQIAAVGTQIAELHHEKDNAGKVLVESSGATGLELALLDAFRKAADAEMLRLEGVRNGYRRQAEIQWGVVSERRREVRLLENLKERKLRGWRADLDREIDAQAGESYLARWGAIRAPGGLR